MIARVRIRRRVLPSRSSGHCRQSRRAAVLRDPCDGDILHPVIIEVTDDDVIRGCTLEGRPDTQSARAIGDPDNNAADRWFLANQHARPVTVQVGGNEAAYTLRRNQDFAKAEWGSRR